MRLLPFFLLSITIFATVDLAVAVRRFASLYMGDGLKYAIYTLTFLFISAGIIRQFFSKSRSLLRIVVLLLVMCIYFLIYRNLKYDIERIHYVEYGLLSILAYRGLKRSISSSYSIVMAVLLSLFTGLTDEMIQHFRPQRVGEIRDVLLNFSAVLLGLTAYLLNGTGSFSRFLKPGRIERKILLLAGFVMIVYLLVFIEIVHGFGYKIALQNGHSFNSSLSKYELAESDSIYGTNSSFSQNRNLLTYINEAERHLQQRNYYDTAKQYSREGHLYYEYGKSWLENVVLREYYPAFLETQFAVWDSVKQATMRGRFDRYNIKEWQSRVKQNTITSVSGNFVRIIFITLAALSIATILIFRDRNDSKLIK